MKKENPPQLTRLEATVHGEVQRAGYRYIVQDTARKFNVKGYVQNMPDGTVKIIAEGPKKAIEKFIKTIQITEPPIHVDRIETKHTKPTSEFEFFSIKYGTLIEELAEGFGTEMKYTKLYIQDIRNIFHKTIHHNKKQTDSSSRQLSKLVEEFVKEKHK